MDGAIAEAGGSECADVFRRDGVGRAGQRQGVCDQRLKPRRYLGTGRIPLQLFQERVIVRQLTESLSVMSYSIVAAVGNRYGYGDRLPLGARQLGRAEHHFAVEVQVPEHGPRGDAVDLQNVRDGPSRSADSLIRRCELAGRRIGFRNSDVSHASELTPSDASGP